MATKRESLRRSSSNLIASGVKILNEERFSSPLPDSSVPLSSSPEKPISLSIAKLKNAPRKKKDQEHYVLKTIKGENINEEDETIDFIPADDARDTEIAEEIHLSGDEGEEVSNEKPEEVTEHVCGKCYRTFRRLNGLQKHLDFCRFDSGYHLRKAEMLSNLDKIEKDAVTMENKDICFCCSESYDTFHLGHINCPDCPKSFKSQMSYERHIFITHSEFDDHPCDICNAKLRSATLLKLHHEQHKNRGKPFACKICGKDFTRSYHLKRHQKYSSCSADINDSMSCKVCNKMFFRLDNLRMHLKQHLGTNISKKPEYMCSICKNCFYSLSTLNIHMRTHTGERPFDCDLCEKKFPSLVALKKHRRYHTGEKPYTCSVCSQSFAVKEVLNRHMKRHTGEKPHKCDECGKCFIQSTQLKTHLRTHIRPWKCDSCDECFKTAKQLTRHQQSHNAKGKRRRNYPCHECNLLFSIKQEYDNHLKSDLHKEAVINSLRTDCDVCKKDFGSIKELQFHMLKEHKAENSTFVCDEPMAIDDDDETQEQHTNNNNNNNKNGSAGEVVEIYDNQGVIGTYNHRIPKTEPENTSGSGLMVHEYIVDEMPSNSQTIILQNHEAFTVIPLSPNPEYTPPQAQNVSQNKKVQRKSLAESLAAAIADNDEFMDEKPSEMVLSAEDLKLKENVGKLLDMLVDKATLKKFGWPLSTEENVLCKVIENCGHNLAQDDETFQGCDYATRMREYVKLLFTVVIHNESIKQLLNNYPIDEVIEYVLGNDDDDDDDEDEGDQCDEKDEKERLKKKIN